MNHLILALVLVFVVQVISIMNNVKVDRAWDGGVRVRGIFVPVIDRGRCNDKY